MTTSPIWLNRPRICRQLHSGQGRPALWVAAGNVNCQPLARTTGHGLHLCPADSRQRDFHPPITGALRLPRASTHADIDETRGCGTLCKWSEKVRRSISLRCADAHGKVEDNSRRRRRRGQLQSVLAVLQGESDAWKRLLDDDPKRERVWIEWTHRGRSASRRKHFNFALQPSAQPILLDLKVVTRLEVEPELLRRSKEARQAQRRVG